MPSTFLWLLFLLSVLTRQSNAKLESAFDPTGGLESYQGSFGEAMAFADHQNKLLLIEFGASDTSPRNDKKASIGDDLQTLRFYNENYIRLSLDGEHGAGACLVKQYEVPGFPSIIFLDAEGRLLFGVMGHLNSGTMLQLGKFFKEHQKLSI